MKTGIVAIFFVLAASAAWTYGTLADVVPQVYRMGALTPSSPDVPSEVRVEVLPGAFQFSVDDARVYTLRLRILDWTGNVAHDSGLSGGPGPLRWEPPAYVGEGRYYYELAAWGEESEFVGAQTGVVNLAPEGLDFPTVTALAFDVPGNFTISGYLGVGLGSPERAVHIRGSNAVFRMDRSANTAAFMIVRTDSANNVLKSYVVGVNASGTNNGSFVINDLGTATAGGGINRLTIANDGMAMFGGEVQASAFITPSSLALKTDICPLENAIETVEKLRGVRFNWKDTGAPSLGFIADEVARVLPEVVALDDTGRPAGIDYGKLTAVLVEAAKSQQTQIDTLENDCNQLAAKWAEELKRVKEKIQQITGE